MTRLFFLLGNILTILPTLSEIIISFMVRATTTLGQIIPNQVKFFYKTLAQLHNIKLDELLCYIISSPVSVFDGGSSGISFTLLCELKGLSVC